MFVFLLSSLILFVSTAQRSCMIVGRGHAIFPKYISQMSVDFS